MHEFAVDLDVIARRRLCTEIRADLPVNRDAPGGDQFVAMPARADARGSEETVETHGIVIRSIVNRPRRFHEVTIQRFTFLHVRFGLGKASDFLFFLPLTAFLQKLDALETLEHVPLGGNRAGPF